jgi:hypothetical protein
VPKCLTIPEETCRDIPEQYCHTEPTLKPAKKTVKECQSCEAYQDVVIDIQYDKKCERKKKPNCYTAYKQVMT